MLAVIDIDNVRVRGMSGTEGRSDTKSAEDNTVQVNKAETS